MGMIPEEFKSILAWSNKSEDFIIGTDNFSDLEIQTKPDGQFYYFYDKRNRRLIKQFVLERKERVDYICKVNLVKKGTIFSPRLAISVRDKTKKIVEGEQKHSTNIKANVDLDNCHDNFWKLIRYLESLKEIEIPDGKFSLVSQNETQIVTALRGRSTESILSIIEQLSNSPDIALTQKDINALLKRKEHLAEFEKALREHPDNENGWQNFFERNKWIFGYGLNYEILRQEQPQPNYGGTKLDGKGGQRGDNLMSTVGDLNFTVLVEIKTPATPLLHGTKEIRNGAWSLSRDLSDALSQIQANIQTWEKEGSRQDDNKDKLEGGSVYTVKPKGIIVIGSLGEFGDDRHKRETFQRFRKSIHGVDIITFDELFMRAKFIVESE